MGLHQVPGTDLAEETGIRVRQEDEDSDVSDLDVEIARELLLRDLHIFMPANVAARVLRRESTRGIQ